LTVKLHGLAEAMIKAIVSRCTLSHQGKTRRSDSPINSHYGHAFICWCCVSGILPRFFAAGSRSHRG